MIGLLGTLIGATIAGIFVVLSNRQRQSFERAKENRELLLAKFEAIHKGLIAYQKLANELSMQMVSEAGYGGKIDPSKLSRDAVLSDLKMNVLFYAPELKDIVSQIEEKHKLIGSYAAKFVLGSEGAGNSKERMAGNAAIETTKSQKLTEEAEKMLADLVSAYINA